MLARNRLPASSGRPASLTCAVDSEALHSKVSLRVSPGRAESAGGNVSCWKGSPQASFFDTLRRGRWPSPSGFCRGQPLPAAVCSSAASTGTGAWEGVAALPAGACALAGSSMRVSASSKVAMGQTSMVVCSKRSMRLS